MFFSIFCCCCFCFRSDSYLKKKYLDICGQQNIQRARTTAQRHVWALTTGEKARIYIGFFSIYLVVIACFCVNGRPFVESNLHCVCVCDFFAHADQSVLCNLYQIDINCCGLFISVRAVKILLHAPNYKIALWLYHKSWQQMCAHKMPPPTRNKKREHKTTKTKRASMLICVCASARISNVNKSAAAAAAPTPTTARNENKFYLAFVCVCVF